MLEHVSCCKFLRHGEYWCDEHQAPERFTSVRMAQLLRSLQSPTQLYQRIQTKVHGNSLLTKTKGALRKLGPKSLQRSQCSSGPSPYDSAMIHHLHEPITEDYLSLQLGVARRFELPVHTAWELSADTYPVELMAEGPGANVPYEPRNNSSPPGMDFIQPMPPSSEGFTFSPESAATVSDANKTVPTLLRFPEASSGPHAFPVPDLSSQFGSLQECSDPVSPISPISPVSSVPSLSTYGGVRSSIIYPSGDPNSGILTDHYSSHPVSTLDNHESAYSTRGSTRTLLHYPTTFEQPATEDVAGSGSGSTRAHIPAWVYPVPKRRPLAPPEQPNESFAAKNNFPKPTNVLRSRPSAEYAHSTEDILQDSLPLRGEDCTISKLLSNPNSDIGAVVDPPVATAKVYQGNTIGFSRSLSTVDHVDKTRVELMQRLDCHHDVASHSATPDHNSLTDTISPASSFPTDSGYGTTSPGRSPDLPSLPATPPRQEFSPEAKRR